MSRSVILSNSSIDFNSESGTFFIESDSPVIDDCPTNKSFASNTLKSAGTKSPADSETISPIVKSLKGIFSFLPFLITEPLFLPSLLAFQQLY